MRLQSDVSRRHMLAISAAAGGLAIGSGLRGASAQAGKRIERLDPSLDAIIDTSQPVQELASGLGGPIGPAEGPVWWKEGHYLLFSDIHNDRRMKYTPGQGVTVFKEHTNRSNGLTRDLQGRLVACSRLDIQLDPPQRGLSSIELFADTAPPERGNVGRHSRRSSQAFIVGPG
jgi:sugar lactone lactonase YvrE